MIRRGPETGLANQSRIFKEPFSEVNCIAKDCFKRTANLPYSWTKNRTQDSRVMEKELAFLGFIAFKFRFTEFSEQQPQNMG